MFVPAAQRNTPQHQELNGGNTSPLSLSGHGLPPGYCPGQPTPPLPKFIPGQPAPPPPGLLPPPGFYQQAPSPIPFQPVQQLSPVYNNVLPLNYNVVARSPSLNNTSPVTNTSIPGQAPRPSTIATNVTTLPSSAPRLSTTQVSPSATASKPGPRPLTARTDVKYENKGYETLTQDMVQSDIFDSYAVDDSVLEVIPVVHAPPVPPKDSIPPKDSFSALIGEFEEFQRDMIAEKENGSGLNGKKEGDKSWVGWLFGGKGAPPAPITPALVTSPSQFAFASEPKPSTAGSDVVSPVISSRKTSNVFYSAEGQARVERYQ
ncbi:UNVERIFIED_CONTAM: hypothetical protein HDU68_007477 [Siphonaria sp. JEL0065]|nr:hypothetical protein HDU68_007477 [Siphonaria sp. JEL0065]